MTTTDADAEFATFTFRALEPGATSANGNPESLSTGVIQMMATGDVGELLAELRADAGLRVDARRVQWAGPQEILMAITQVAGTVGALAGGAGGVLGGVAGMLALYQRRHPEATIQVDLPSGVRVTVTGDMSPETATLINGMFDSHRPDLSTQEFLHYGPGTAEL